MSPHRQGWMVRYLQQSLFRPTVVPGLQSMVGLLVYIDAKA